MSNNVALFLLPNRWCCLWFAGQEAFWSPPPPSGPWISSCDARLRSPWWSWRCGSCWEELWGTRRGSGPGCCHRTPPRSLRGTRRRWREPGQYGSPLVESLSARPSASYSPGQSSWCPQWHLARGRTDLEWLDTENLRSSSSDIIHTWQRQVLVTFPVDLINICGDYLHKTRN